MEWVETTGRTIEEATELALEQLGVEAEDADVEVVEEPRSGLFGRTRGQARVRARVRPKEPRPKQERRRKGGRSGGRGAADGGAAPSDAAADQDREDATSTAAAPPAEPAAPPERRKQQDRQRPAKEREGMDNDEQTRTVEGFLTGLTEAMGVGATVSVEFDDGAVAASITGDDLGLLVGPRLATLEAVQEIARNVLQREAGEREHGKVVLDVAGVREVRREAMVAFVSDAAQRVRDEGMEVAFEVMSSPDRKLVHDIVGDLDGVESVSEGEDPRRRVVIRPA